MVKRAHNEVRRYDGPKDSVQLCRWRALRPRLLPNEGSHDQQRSARNDPRVLRGKDTAQACTVLDPGMNLPLRRHRRKGGLTWRHRFALSAYDTSGCRPADI